MVHYKDSIFGLKNAWVDNVMSMFILLFNILWLNPLSNNFSAHVFLPKTCSSCLLVKKMSSCQPCKYSPKSKNLLQNKN